MKQKPVARSGSETILVSDGNSARVVRVESEYRFAYELKNAARVMANSARKVADDDHYELRAFVTGAVTLSYSYLEAAANEFIHLNSVSDRSHLTSEQKAVMAAMAREELRPVKRQNTLQILNTLLRLIGKPELVEKEEPYQSANLVRSLRNLLIHPVPGRVVTYLKDPDSNLSEQQQIVRQLRGPLGLPRDATFPWDVLTSSCADWAVQSCERFFRDFVEASEVDPEFITNPLYLGDKK